MLDIAAVMTEVDTRLKTITTLTGRTRMGVDGAVAPPAAIQFLPDRIDYDKTYGRGLDLVSDLCVLVVVGKSNMRGALTAINPYIATAGASSVKAKLDFTAAAPYASCSDFQVVYCEIDLSARLGGVDYLGALFHCNFAGYGG